MTAIDELRRLLDERGVKWRLVNGDCILWTDADGAKYRAIDGFTFKGPDGTVTVFNMTPAQAVEATLGSRDAAFDAGFSSGVNATLQQLYGLLHDYPTLDEIEDCADSQWKEEA